MKNIISDYNHPAVIAKSAQLTAGFKTQEDKIREIFLYVRDGIKFKFLENADAYKASEIIGIGAGQCNNKVGTFLALCKAAGMEARAHFSGIRKEIQRGLFTGLAYRLMPDLLSHGWIEINLSEEWVKIDSFINDLDFYKGGKQELARRNWKTGFSISCESGESSADFNLEGNRFVQMDAVEDDHGVYEDPSEYYASGLHKNKLCFCKKIIYMIFLKGINARVRKTREGQMA